MICKNTILNTIVANAADIMESRVEMNELIIEQLEEKGGKEETVAKLKDLNRRATEAIELMREYGGCWT